MPRLLRPARAGIVALAAGVLITMPLASWATTADRVIPESKGAGWAALSTGQDHTCGIRIVGTLWCWGAARYGQLGLGGFEEQDYPTQVGQDNDWMSIDLGGDHSCGIRADHTLWCWGLNSLGELGVGDYTNRYVPTQVGTDEDWASVSAGSADTCGVRLNSTLWCWGDGQDGRLGNGGTGGERTPARVAHGTHWVSVSAGGTHTCGIRRESQGLWCWGSNYYGQLGQGNQEDRYTPRPVARGTTWVSVSAGTGYTCAVASDDSLWCWGDNESGELGTGDEGMRLVPAQVGKDLDWASVGASAPTCFDPSDCAAINHTCGTRSDHSLWCWGANQHGELGLGDKHSKLIPSQVGRATTWDVISTGGEDSCGTRNNQTLWCWGLGDQGKLGLGDTADRLTPSHVTGAPNRHENQELISKSW